MSVRNTTIAAEALDARWFLALKSIKRPLLLHSLALDSAFLALEKIKVIEEDGYNPVFRYSTLDISSIKVALAALLQLREQVCQEESNKSIAELYKGRLAELILEQEILLASVQGDWNAFNALNHKLYGEVNQDFAHELLSVVQQKTSVLNEMFHIKLSALPVVPSQALFDKARQVVKGPDIAVVPDVVYSSENIVAVWNESLLDTMPKWRTVIDTRVMALLVAHKSRTIKIPPNLKMKAKRMRKLFVHEIGTHVYRREQGKHNKLQLYSIGLAGNQIIEEGLAIMRSQLLGNKFHYYGGFDKYLALAYAQGTVDGSPKDFNQTFNFLKAYFLDRLDRKSERQQNQTIAEERAWNCTVRIFRGGNPSIPGCCLLRDKIYHEGNRAIWQMFETNPEHFRIIMLGKFNPEDDLQRQMCIEYTNLTVT